MNERAYLLTVTLWALVAWGFVVLMLTGCDLDRPLTNAEISQAIDYCHAHHLQPVVFTAYGDKRNMVYAIKCRADDETTPASLGEWSK